MVKLSWRLVLTAPPDGGAGDDTAWDIMKKALSLLDMGAIPISEFLVRIESLTFSIQSRNSLFWVSFKWDTSDSSFALVTIRSI